jgi:serine/threonine protein kinase
MFCLTGVVCFCGWLPCAGYRLIAKQGEGTFSEVLKAQCLRSDNHVAIKCMKARFDSLEQVLSWPEVLLYHAYTDY